MLFTLLIILSIMFTYVEVIRLGMPVKRWLSCSLLLGPATLLLMRVHYRRAWLKANPAPFCCWRC